MLENITDDEGKSIQYLIGNVKFQKGETTITANRATYKDRDEIGWFVDSVKLNKNEQVLTTDSLVFDSGKDKVIGLGHIHFTDTEYELISDTLTYFLQADSGIASGNIQFFQKKQIITADHLTYRKKEDEEAASYTAFGEVIIQEETRKANCGRCIYDAPSETSILLENPTVIQEGQTLSGEEIRLFYVENVLQQVLIPNRAHITNLNKGKVEKTVKIGDSTEVEYTLVEFEDDMTGKRLEAYLEEGKLDSVRLEGMATTYYHLFEDSIYQGQNIASGDTIMLLFVPDSSGKEDLQTINIFGGSRGEYHPDDSSEDIDAPIFYQADTIFYSIPDEETILQKSAQIDYKTTQLKSGIISVSWENNLLHAIPEPETEELSPQEFPTILERGREPMVGQSLTYNLSTGRGQVRHGTTKMDDGYYKGEEIRNRTSDSFYVTRSVYTTCDLDPNPHFHFESSKMKMIKEDKVIVKPIVLYIAGIPIFALPFGVFPDQSGKRHSGWIMPSYGESSQQGQYLKGLGYFWAVNDFINSQYSLDFYDKRGIVFHNTNRYFKRYGFNGNLNFRYNRTVENQEITDILHKPGAVRWSLAWNHSQKLRKNQSLNVNAKYYSDSQFNRKLGIHRDTRLNQKAVSNATYSKRWPKQNISVSFNLSETRNLMIKEKINPSSIYYQTPTQSGMRLTETSTVLPSLTIRKGQAQLFKRAQKRGSGPSFYWSYGSTFKNRGTGYYESDSIGVDTVGTTIYNWDDSPHYSMDNSWIHNMSLSGSDKLLKYIAIRPSISFREEWITKYYDADSVDIQGNPITKHEVQTFRARRTASLSLSANTKLYGLFPIRIGSLQAIRHTITPSIGFSFQPDYSKPLFGYEFGYFKTLKDSEGKEHLFDPFRGTQIGATSRQERRNLNLSIKNVFQAKVKQGEEEKKINNLLTWNMSTSYNFAAEEFNLSKLRSSIRARLPQKLNLDFSMSHDFYDFESKDNTITRINRIISNQWGIPTPRLVEMSAATGFRLSGKQIQRPGVGTAAEDTTVIDTAEYDDLSATRAVRPETVSRKPMSGGKVWDMRLSLRYSANRFNPTKPKDSFWLNTNLRFQLTKYWGIQYNARFDLLTRDMISHDINIHRDLHCWQLNFTWTPGGFGRGFYLRINVKSPTLSDLKLESRGGRWEGPSI